ncbi:MAG TPA: DUF4363 family protein [Clostridia bacterium]|nr:DUF4363 family protein [Clostridia bacterium]
MRVFIATMIAFVLFLGLAWWNTSYLNKTSEQLADRGENIRKLVFDEKWEDADIEVLQIRRLWGHHKKTWLLFFDHQDIDSIDNALYRINEMIRCREKAQALSDIAEFRFYVQDISDKENLSLANIF